MDKTCWTMCDGIDVRDVGTCMEKKTLGEKSKTLREGSYVGKVRL